MNNKNGNITIWLVVLLVAVVGIFSHFQFPRYFKYTKEPSDLISESPNSSNDTNSSMYEVTVEKLKQPLNHTFEVDSNSPSLFEYERLVFTHKETGEKKSFSLYELLDETILDEFKTIEYEIQNSLSINLLKFNEENTHYYGMINIVPSADPPVYDSASIFKINTNTWELVKYPLPIQSFFHVIKPEALNTELGTILIEVASPDNQLYLYAYNFVTAENNLLKQYDKATFQTELPGEYGYLGYFYPNFANGESKGIDAKWLDINTISYTDFVTRKEIIMTLD